VGKKINANQIHFKMHPVYGNKCFTERTVHICCKKMLGGQTFCIIYGGAISYSSSVILQWHGQQAFFCSRHSEVCWQVRQMF